MMKNGVFPKFCICHCFEFKLIIDIRDDVIHGLKAGSKVLHEEENCASISVFHGKGVAY